MAQAKFVLKEPKGKEKTLIYLIFRFNSQKLKYSTGEKILPAYWNSSKQRVKELRSYPEYSEFNSRLNHIETAVNTAYRKLLNDNEVPTKDNLRLELESYFRPKQISKEQHPTFYSFLDSYIESVKNVRQGSTIVVYLSTIKHLKAYEQDRKITLEFLNINLDFYHDFINYLSEQGIYNNTIGKYIKTIKSFLREAEAAKINVNQDYKSPKFKVYTEEPETIYLTEPELESLYSFDFSQNKELEEIRDLFLIGAFTGLRFSDFTRLEKVHIHEVQGNKIIKIRAKKTGELVVIPLHWIVEEILISRNYQMPKGITNDIMNLLLKNVGKALKLETSVIRTRKKGNQSIIEKSFKFEQLTTHTARRSFASNCFLNGMPAIGIMKITGHKTEKSFLRYIRVSGEDNAILLANHSFFKRNIDSQ